MSRICIVGLGYIGLPTALLLGKEHDVTGFDINEDIVSRINRKEIPFLEPGMDELLKSSGIMASTQPVSADVFIICVPTPFDKEVRMADLRHVKQAVEAITPFLCSGNLVVIESTIPPGACEKVVIPIIECSHLKVGSDILLSHCPERAIPGNTFKEMVFNDRIIGGINSLSADITMELYRTFVKGTIYKTDIRTAEFVKLVENTFRDVNIALANELAMLAEDSGINVWKAISLANKHPRVNILLPGPGVGGHCIAVDPWFLTESSCNVKIISMAREINDNMPSFILSKIKRILQEEGITNPVITILGVAYKGNIDDTRETPALKLIKLCEKEGWNVKIFDPLVRKFDYPLLSFDESLRNTDLIIVEV
ncbi:MAG: nucleotide sugar dehydrogenase, partial [Methanospirillum sp.]|uniref:nucleotide sugar dehydrogenase n=1 Tax=Methanospirillum sp. TaxID=45200 RepID=UPI0023693671